MKRIKYTVFIFVVFLVVGMFYLVGCGTMGSSTRGDTSMEEVADIDQLLGLTDDNIDADETIAEDDVLKLLGVLEEGESSVSQSQIEERSHVGEGIRGFDTERTDSESRISGFNDKLSQQEMEISSLENERAQRTVRSSERKSPVWESSLFPDRYQEALQTYNTRNYRNAIQKFEDLLATNSKHSLSDNCQYWIGESYYGLGNFQQAVIAFEKVFSFSNSNKDDDAQLKLGLCYLRLNNKPKAKEEFQKLVDNYPTSEYVSVAKRFINKID